MAEKMSERIKRLYEAGRLDNTALIVSLKRGLITEMELAGISKDAYMEYVNSKNSETAE